MRYITLLLLAALMVAGVPGLPGASGAFGVAWAANPAHLHDVTYEDGVVTLQFTEPTNYKTTFWKSARKFIVDVEAAGIDLRIGSLPVGAPKVDAVRWKQRERDSVRIVLDLTSTDQPAVLTSPPTNIIPIRVARAGSPEAALRRPAAPRTDSRTEREPEILPAVWPGDRPAESQTERQTEKTPSVARDEAPAAQIGDIQVLRGSDGRPERVIVRTDREISVRATWWNNRLAIDMPEAARTRERIIPVNDPVLLRVRTGTFEGHGRVVVDTTQRINYKLSVLDDGRGFALDCILPAPGAPPPVVVDDGTSMYDADTPIDAPVGDSLRGKLIVLDPGHGDFDKGARSQWATEKVANLDIAIRLRRVLESVGAQVVMTRSDDTFVPLRQRPAVAMRLKADAFVSIHCNSSARPTNSGTEVFYRRGDAESRRLATVLYRAHRAATGLSGRGVKSDSSAPQGGLAVLKHNTVPNALVEVGFLNNPTEGRKIADPEWRQITAEGLAKGLARFMEGQG